MKTAGLNGNRNCFLYRRSIPPDSYVDCRDQDPQAIHRMIKATTQEKIVSCRMRAIDFLKSNAADRFGREYWAGEVVKRLKSQDPDKNQETSKYRV